MSKYANLSDPEDEMFARSPLIFKYNSEDKENLAIELESPQENEPPQVKTKKNKVPSNITCHCAGNLLQLH